MRFDMKTVLFRIAVILSILSTAGVSSAANTYGLFVSATVLSKSNCKFNSATATLNFVSLNPASTGNATASTSITFICRGSAANATYNITQNYGLYNTGPNANRMQNTTVLTQYLPYTVSLSPFTATVPKNATQTLTITGTILATDYENAYVGSYSDTIVISLNP